jgi:hypothetical protein
MQPKKKVYELSCEQTEDLGKWYPNDDDKFEELLEDAQSTYVMGVFSSLEKVKEYLLFNTHEVSEKCYVTQELYEGARMESERQCKLTPEEIHRIEEIIPNYNTFCKMYTESEDIKYDQCVLEQFSKKYDMDDIFGKMDIFLKKCPHYNKYIITLYNKFPSDSEVENEWKKEVDKVTENWSYSLKQMSDGSDYHVETFNSYDNPVSGYYFDLIKNIFPFTVYCLDEYDTSFSIRPIVLDDF